MMNSVELPGVLPYCRQTVVQIGSIFPGEAEMTKLQKINRQIIHFYGILFL